MHIVFIVLLVVIVLIGLVALIVPMTDKKTGKPYKKSEMLLGFGVMAAIIGVLIFVTTPHPKPYTAPKAVVKEESKPVTPVTAKKPTAAELKALGTKTLTDKVNEYDKLYNDVSLAATKPDASTSNSTFWHYWDDIEHSLKYDTYIDAFNNVSNSYFNANITQPPTLDTWSSDMATLWTDIQNYTQSEHDVLGDKAYGSDTTKNQNKVTTFDAKYKTDLAKVNSDIVQL